MLKNTIKNPNSANIAQNIAWEVADYINTLFPRSNQFGALGSIVARQETAKAESNAGDVKSNADYSYAAPEKSFLEE